MNYSYNLISFEDTVDNPEQHSPVKDCLQMADEKKKKLISFDAMSQF